MSGDRAANASPARDGRGITGPGTGPGPHGGAGSSGGTSLAATPGSGNYARIRAVSIGALTPAADLGGEPEIMWLPIDVLVVDKSYQRSLTRKSFEVVDQIVTKFRWSLFQPITVADLGDGRYAVVDGQHRATAAATHPAITSVPALVIAESDLESQARAFVAINGCRLGMSAAQIYRAELLAGAPDALHLKAVLDAAGLSVQANQLTAGVAPLKTRAVRPIQKLLRDYGDGPVTAALRMIAAGHAERWNVFSGPVVKTVTEAVRAVREGGGDEAALAARVAATDLVTLLAGEQAVCKVNGGQAWRRAAARLTGQARRAVA